MKKPFMIITALLFMLIVGSVRTYAFRVDAREPDSFRTVTLEIEGMT